MRSLALPHRDHAFRLTCASQTSQTNRLLHLVSQDFQLTVYVDRLSLVTSPTSISMSSGISTPAGMRWRFHALVADVVGELRHIGVMNGLSL